MAIITDSDHTGDGSIRVFNITFEYIDEGDIKVSLNGVDTNNWQLLNATTIQFTADAGGATATQEASGAPKNAVAIRIYRETDVENLRATFFAGSSIRAQDLNANFEQNNFAVQEIQQNAWDREADTIEDNEAWVSDDNHVATTAALDDRFWDQATDTIDSTEAWVSDNDHIATTAAMDARFQDEANETILSTEAWVENDDTIPTTLAAATQFDTFVQLAQPTTNVVGKTWLQNDDDLTIRMWDGTQWVAVTSGGTFQTLDNVFYVAETGLDSNNGNRISAPLRSIGEAIDRINNNNIDGATVVVYPGVYSETFPINIERSNVAIVGQSQRNCIVRPDVSGVAGYSAATPSAPELSTMFRLNSGSYIANLTLMGMKASGAVGGNAIDTNATHGVATNQGWNFEFFPGAVIRKSPYIQNCTNFSDSAIDNSLAAAAYQVQTNGAGGDITSGLAGGGILIDGSVPAANSPLRSMVCDSYTHVSLNGPGILVTNNGYCQATSSYAFFNRYHIKCLNGGQANLAASTSDFGNFSLIAEGRSPNNIFTGELVGQIAAAAPGDPATTTFTIDTMTANTDLYGNPADPRAWFGNTERPRDNMVVELDGEWYEVRDSVANGAGWDVTIFRPDPTNRTINIGLDLTSAIADNTVASFFLRSQIASSGHTMEFVGSGTDYNALPENGGEPDPTTQITEVAANAGELVGKVYTAITDHNGNFQVGPLTVDQKNNTLSIAANSGTLFAVSGDASPQLGGNLDANGFDIILDTGAAGTPSLTFTGDTDSGLFSGGANTVNITTNGVERAEFGPTEVVFNDGGEDYDFRVEGDTVDNLFVVDASADAIDINGATTVTGSVTIDGGGDLHVGNDALIVGSTGTAAFTAVSVSDAGIAEVALLNTDTEDADGGRDSAVTFSGTQSGSEVSMLADIVASHDGTADDEAGQLVISTNSGADGNTPTAAVTIDSNQDVTLANDLTVTNNTITPQINGYNQTAAGEGGLWNRKNFFDNGEFYVDERNSTAWFADRWTWGGPGFVEGVAVKQRVSQAAVDLPPGFTIAAGALCTAVETTLGNGRLLYFWQDIEAVNLSSLNPGTAAARSFTLSFWVRSNKAGNYGVSIWKNNDGTNQRIRGATFNISAAEATANEFVHRSITFEGDTNAAGAFAFNANRGFRVNFILEAGSDWLADLSSWQNYVDANQNYVDDGHDVNFTDSTSNNILFTGMQLELGDVATPYEFRQYDDELKTCLRYFESLNGVVYCTSPYSGYTSYVTWQFKERKRQIPTFSLSTNGTTYGAARDTVTAYKTSLNAYITSPSTADAETDWD